ncbi:hypothetical protein CWM52_00295 [Raoultella sp. T31]|nr:hypothetical protein CWM52_00295 [Raoultella sp. T31]
MALVAPVGGPSDATNMRQGEVSEMKKPPVGGFTTLLIALIILLLSQWYPERDLNSYSLWPRDFKSCAFYLIIKDI